MKKFEYTAISAQSPAYIDEVLINLNEMGADGWELTGFNYGRAFFKREVPSHD